MDSSDILFYSVLVLIIPLNALFIWLTIKRSLVKSIKPTLEQFGIELLDYKWAGLFSAGDFKKEFILTNYRGGPKLSLYVHLYLKKANQQQKITARIDTLFFFTQKVVYSKELSS